MEDFLCVLGAKGWCIHSAGLFSQLAAGGLLIHVNGMTSDVNGVTNDPGIW